MRACEGRISGHGLVWGSGPRSTRCMRWMDVQVNSASQPGWPGSVLLPRPHQHPLNLRLYTYQWNPVPETGDGSEGERRESSILHFPNKYLQSFSCGPAGEIMAAHLSVKAGATSRRRMPKEHYLSTWEVGAVGSQGNQWGLLCSRCVVFKLHTRVPGPGCASTLIQGTQSQCSGEVWLRGEVASTLLLVRYG